MGILFLIYLTILCIIESAPWGGIAMFIWFGGVSILHAKQEIDGRLWEYFGKITGNSLVKGLGSILGSLFIVIPALALQIIAAWNGFFAEDNVFWLGILIGARLGDALFSHFLPSAMGHRPNPGYVSAVVYFIDALILLFWGYDQLNHHEAWTGALIGAGFFAGIQPLMKLMAFFTKRS